MFLTESEKSSLGVFVCSPFTNYNKSKELLEKHFKKDFHLRAVDRAYEFKKTWLNPAGRIDTHIMDCSAKNFMLNSKILPLIVEVVLLCARQKIALQGHQQDKIDFALPAMRNEGNFIAMLRLLSKNNATLHEHLTFGAKNAKYALKQFKMKFWELLLIRFVGFIEAVFTVVHIFHL